MESKEMRAELRQILDAQLEDRRSAWDMQPDNSYRRRTPTEGEDPRPSQERFIAEAKKLASRTKERLMNGSSRKPG